MKDKIKVFLADQVYGLYEKKILKNKIQVMSIEETLDELLQTEKSLVRFGDGEIIMIRGKKLYFQEASQEVARRLAEILKYQDDNLMVAIPAVFEDLQDYQISARKFWKDHLLFFRNVYDEFCDTQKRYGNAFVSRCYYNYQDKSKAEERFRKFSQLWQGKDIVVVEGSGTHNGVGNDLLASAKSIQRVICPPENAAAKLEEIMAACLQCPRGSLYLLSIGPTAKLLAEDLHHTGRRVIDIGNLDMEYEWFRMNAKEKNKLLKHRILSEAENRAAGYDEYLSEIVTRIV